MMQFLSIFYIFSIFHLELNSKFCFFKSVFFSFTGDLRSYLHAVLQRAQRLPVLARLSRQHLVQLHLHLVQSLPEQPANTEVFLMRGAQTSRHNPSSSKVSVTSPSAPETVSPDPSFHLDTLLSSAHSLHRPFLHKGHIKETYFISAIFNHFHGQLIIFTFT